MIGWTIGGRVHGKPSARKVTYLRVIPTLGSLTLEFPWDPGEGLGYKPPMCVKLIVPEGTL